MLAVGAADSGIPEAYKTLGEDEAQHALDVGLALRRAREACGYTLRDIYAATRITERNLAAIEASEFEFFRAPLYAVGFAKTFARAVGVSEPWIASQVKRQIASMRVQEPVKVAPPK